MKVPARIVSAFAKANKDVKNKHLTFYTSEHLASIAQEMYPLFVTQHTQRTQRKAMNLARFTKLFSSAAHFTASMILARLAMSALGIVPDEPTPVSKFKGNEDDRRVQLSGAAVAKSYFGEETAAAFERSKKRRARAIRQVVGGS